MYTAADGSQHSYVTIVNTQTQTVSLGYCAAPHGNGRERLWQQGQVRRHAISIPVKSNIAGVHPTTVCVMQFLSLLKATLQVCIPPQLDHERRHMLALPFMQLIGFAQPALCADHRPRAGGSAAGAPVRHCGDAGGVVALRPDRHLRHHLDHRHQRAQHDGRGALLCRFRLSQLCYAGRCPPLFRAWITGGRPIWGSAMRAHVVLPDPWREIGSTVLRDPATKTLRLPSCRTMWTRLAMASFLSTRASTR